MSVGETDSTSAMFSNPSSSSSGGSSASGSTSSPNRSRTALLYSTRLRRCTVVRPGFGSAAAARSNSSSSQPATVSYVTASGRGRPAGGIMPLRSFATTFSHASACAPTSSASSRSREIGTVPARSPLSLWQARQYCSSTGRTGGACAPASGYGNPIAMTTIAARSSNRDMFVIRPCRPDTGSAYRRRRGTSCRSATCRPRS